jgi:probable rRNA maturation factor
MVGDANLWGTLGLSASGLTRFLRAAQQAVGLEGEVHVLLADDATLRRLNRTFRGKDKATDVLSFPAGPTTVFFGEPEAPPLAGDLAISLETAAQQAARFGHSLRDEVRVLLLHGVLHLAGFDHEADTGEMAAREAELRRRLGLPTGLIARASAKGKLAQERSNGTKVQTIKVRSTTSGSLGSSAHGKAESASGQDDKTKRSTKAARGRARS